MFRRPIIVVFALVLAFQSQPASAIGEKYRVATARDPGLQSINAQGLDGAGKASALNQAALGKAFGGDLHGALSGFQEALRHHEHPEYHTNLGVTLMRMGRAWDAKSAFDAALAMAPGFQLAVDNLRDLIPWMNQHGLISDTFDDLYESQAAMGSMVVHGAGTAQAPQHVTKQPPPGFRWSTRRRSPTTTRADFSYLQHKTLPFPRVNASNLREAAHGRTPFIITGLTSSSREWRASRAVNDWDFQYFREQYGDRRSDFYPHNMGFVGVQPFMPPLSVAIDEALHPSGTYPSTPDRPGTYIQWNVNYDDWKVIVDQLGPLPEMFRDFETWMPDCLETNALRTEFTFITHWHMVLLGTPGAGIFNHWDIMQSAAWQVQVRGRKLWHICSPDNSTFMHNAGDIDGFDPDYATFPDMRNAVCWLDVVEEGDAVYYPSGYWHQTENLSQENIAVSGSVIDTNCWQDVMREFEAECSQRQRRFHFTPPVCEALLGRCRQWWSDAFKGGFQGGKSRTCTRRSDKHLGHVVG